MPLRSGLPSGVRGARYAAVCPASGSVVAATSAPTPAAAIAVMNPLKPFRIVGSLLVAFEKSFQIILEAVRRIVKILQRNFAKMSLMRKASFLMLSWGFLAAAPVLAAPPT